MKISAALAFAAVGGASAYSVNRSTIRSLGSKSVGTSARRNVGASIKMEGEQFVSSYSPLPTTPLKPSLTHIFCKSCRLRLP